MPQEIYQEDDQESKKEILHAISEAGKRKIGPFTVLQSRQMTEGQREHPPI